MRTLVRFARLMVIFLACASCRSTPIAPEDVIDDDACSLACSRLAALGCAEAAPTDGGASCVAVCQNAQASGVVSLEPECVANVAGCDDVDRCVHDAR